MLFLCKCNDFNKPGVFARDNYTNKGFSYWWERPKDLSVVIDYFLAESTFGPHIDPARIGAGGFSLGGLTVIVIAGGIVEFSRYQVVCNSPRKDAMCIDPPEFPGLLAKIAEMAKSDPGLPRVFVARKLGYNF